MHYVIGLDEIDETQVAAVGGKGAHLGALTGIAGIDVPAGFCVTTDAFRSVMAATPAVADPLKRLSRLQPDDRTGIRTVSAEVRDALETAVVPADVASAITAGVARLGADAAYAVRSSATAEDLPGASFAGQHDSYLDVVGEAAIVQHVRRCWASLFTEQAVSYRLRNGFGHRGVHMAVVVQRMVFPHAAGILFTADPVTSDRTVARVEATAGLGDALVSGLVTPDGYTVRGGVVVERTIVAGQPLLTDEQAVRLVDVGRRIEAHFGQPQDIEWCLVDDSFLFVQSRPVTTLFPVPAAPDDSNRVYLSVGHQQMMTDAMTPLGLSVWQLTTPQPMAEAGGRLFVDVTSRLASPTIRDGFLDMLGDADPRIRDALETVLGRGFVAPVPESPGRPPAGAAATPTDVDAPDIDPTVIDATVIAGLVERTEASVATLRRDIAAVSGPAVFDVILSDVGELTRILFDPLGLQVITAGFEATTWLNRQLLLWLGERNAADTLAQSVPNNITSEMGLALLDVADVIRPHPDVVAFLQQVEGDDFLDALPRLAGGTESRDAITAFLDRYGMRCAGEIDITRPRWSEQPSTLVPAILGNVRNFEPGAAGQRFDQGRREAASAAQSLLARLRALPDGDRKADETERTIDRLRTVVGYREYPKYGMICRYFAYKQALLREVDRLVRAGTLRERDDCYFLRFDELHKVARTDRVDHELIRSRREAFASYRSLTPPRVLTSDGETVNGSYRRDDLPPGALAGLPVSAGTVDGRARVVTDLALAELEPGDILVTAFTDPSWTPLFVTIAGLVTEVGGVMTHGAVIAREYGLPAVVGVDRATQVIEDGRRIRVHGTEGYVELLT